MPYSGFEIFGLIVAGIFTFAMVGSLCDFFLHKGKEPTLLMKIMDIKPYSADEVL